MEEEADVDVCRRGERRRGAVGEELERHGGRVVGDTVEVAINLRQLCEAKEGLETSVGAELDVYFAFAAAGDGAVKGLKDLACEGGAGDGADGVGVVEGEIPFVGVGEGAGLKRGGGGVEVRGGEGGGAVVD